MYRIGEFSYLCETTIKTLRYYNKINLLNPKKIDELTGYRYYTDDQIETFNKIKVLQTAGFKLTEIKNMLKDMSEEKIENQLKKIQEEYSKKIDILNHMKKENQTTPMLITNPKYHAIGKLITLKNRSELPTIIQKFPKELEKLNTIFISYEKGYQEKKIKAFVGKVLDEKTSTNYNLISKMLKQGYSHDSDQMPPTYLYLKTQNIIEGYKELITYANKKNIQIRGPFQEITENNQTHIYVEAYDLNIENEDAIQWKKSVKEKLEKTNNHPKKWIGTWYLQGEITELPKMVKYKRKHYLPDTKYKKLELQEDGTTNFKNITWKDKYLIIHEKDQEYYHILSEPTKKLLNTYMEVLINQKESNARPYIYYYKKGKKNEKI